jgi:ribA/ribD-fused uncharacterized protein
MKQITLFRNEFFFLSNLYPCSVTFNGILFKSVEHGYMYHKATSTKSKSAILLIEEPLDVKKYSKRMGKIRDDWHDVKYSIMYELVYAKFSQNTELRDALLLTTGITLIEGNWWGDMYWGVCDGVGSNHLGHILMDVRDRLST